MLDEFGDNWESLEIRPLLVEGLSDLDLPLDYYEATEAPFTATDSLDVWFRISTAGILDYSGDPMHIAGIMNDWIGEPLTQEGEDSEFWSGQYSFADTSEVSY